MKIISYSLFAPATLHDKNTFEYRSYVRGFYWNFRMNQFIYPEWKTHVELDEYTYNEFKGLFEWLVVTTNNLSISINKPAHKCEAMLWRMKPVFLENVTHVICRDTDAITTYKEAKCVQEWIESGLGFHAINDNPAHGGLMGGMVGFNTAKFKAFTGFNNWLEMMASDTGFDYKQHGADQNFLNKCIYPKVASDLFMHNLAGSGIQAKTTVLSIKPFDLPLVNPKLWESDLTCRHIGSAGVVEMETIRFFKRFDEYDWNFQKIEKQFPQLFYWNIN